MIGGYNYNRSIIPDSIPGPEADPLRDGTVLLLRLGELLLCAEGFVALRFWEGRELARGAVVV